MAMLCALALASSLVACGGGGDDAVAPPVTLATEAVGPGGGQLVIDAASLTLPAGALATEATVVLESTPVDAASGELLRLRFAPAGQRLATPAVLTVDVPAAPAAAQAFWLVDGDPVLTASTRVGDRFSITLKSLGYGADGRRLPLDAGRARRLASGDATAGELSMRVLNCQGKVEILRRRMARLATNDAMAEAELLIDAVLDAAQNCNELEVQLLRQTACEQLAAAATDASLSLPTSLSELGALVARLFGAQSIVETAGATCNPEVDVSALIADRTDGYLAILGGQVRRGDFATEPGVRELRALFDIGGACQLLGIDEACGRLRTQIFPDMLDAMRRSAFDDCRDRGAALSVAQFLDLGSVSGRDGPFMNLARFRMADVEADLVQCTAPTLSVRVFDTVDGSPQALPDRDLELQPFNGFNDYRLAGTVRPPRTGQVVLEGAVRVARCPDGSAPAADLVVRIADGARREVARRPHDGVRFSFTRPIDLAVTDLFQAAALDPATATTVSLIVTQEGASCPSQVSSGQVVLDRPLPFFQLDVGVAGSAAGAPGPVVVQGTVTANVLITATLRGNRNRLESFEGLLLVFDTTTETADVTLSYDVVLPVPAGTVVQPGSRTSLSGAALGNLNGPGQARVDSRLEARTGSCVITRAGTASTAVTLANPQAPGGGLELTSDGQLGISIGGLQGTYVTTSTGAVSGSFSTGCSNPTTFNTPFGPGPVASEFIVLNGARATTALPDRGTTSASSSTFISDAFFQTSLCGVFLREHLRLLEPRLLSSEQITSCTQQTTLSWQLQRE